MRGSSVAVAFPKEGKVAPKATDEDTPYGFRISPISAVILEEAKPTKNPSGKK